LRAAWLSSSPARISSPDGATSSSERNLVTKLEWTERASSASPLRRSASIRAMWAASSSGNSSVQRRAHCSSSIARPSRCASLTSFEKADAIVRRSRSRSRSSQPAYSSPPASCAAKKVAAPTFDGLAQPSSRDVGFEQRRVDRDRVAHFYVVARRVDDVAERPAELMQRVT